MNKHLVIKKKDIIFFLIYIIMLFPFFKIPYITVIEPKFGTIYLGLSVVSFAIVILLKIKNKFFSKTDIFLILFLFSVFISTLISKGDFYQTFSLILSILFFTFFIELGFRIDKKVFMNSFEFFLYFLVVLNFATILCFPEGLYASSSTNLSFYTTNNWFFGFKNNHIVFILPALFISFFNSSINKNKISFRCYLLFAISIISVFLVNSSTSLLSLVIFFCLFIYFKHFRYKFDYKKLLFIFFIVFFGIVIFRMQNIFEFLIVDVLNKDITLTNRVFIWDYVINFILQKPFFGYGIEETAVRYFKTFVYQSYHAHNLILEIIYRFGFVGFGLLINYVVSVLKNIKNPDINNCLIFLFIFTYLILGITEFYALDIMFIFLSFLINYDKKGGECEN